MTALVKRMQRFIANASVASSAVRQGPRAVKGVAKSAIKFLSDIDMSVIVGGASFYDFLDEQTEKLRFSFPSGVQY
jgi:hypothetical protein